MCYEEKCFGRVKRPRNDFAGSPFSSMGDAPASGQLSFETPDWRAARPVAERRPFPAKPHVPRVPCAPVARSPGSRGTAPCASREARCRTAATPQPSRISPCSPARPARRDECRALPCQTGEPWHLSCHGGKTPTKPHVALRPCAPKARSPGSRGTAPCAHEIFRKLLGRAKVVSSGFFFSDEGKYGIIQCVGQVAGRKRPG